jgi:hypothetical protein
MLRRHRGESTPERKESPENIGRRRESPDNTVRRSLEARGHDDSHLQRERERAQGRERDRVDHKQTPRRRAPSQDTVPFIAKVIELLERGGGGGGGGERVRLCCTFRTDSIYQRRRKTKRLFHSLGCLIV